MFAYLALFPDGSVFREGELAIRQPDHLPAEIASILSLDGERRCTRLTLPPGEVEFIWTGSPDVAVATLILDSTTVSASIFLPGQNPEVEKDILEYFLNAWRGFPVVKDLGSGSLFDRVHDIDQRPLLFSMNWATANPGTFAQLDFELPVARNYFCRVLSDSS